MDCGLSTTLYIGVSRGPCYCCSLFVKAVEEKGTANFRISLVTTNGKIYQDWNKMQSCFQEEFKQVWQKVIECLNKRIQLQKRTAESSCQKPDEDVEYTMYEKWFKRYGNKTADI